MKRILITNDDGFESQGLHALARALRPLGQVTIVAPTSENPPADTHSHLPDHFVLLLSKMIFTNSMMVRQLTVSIFP